MPQWVGCAIKSRRHFPLQASEDSSEYTTDDESEEDSSRVMLKPAFVPKMEREVRHCPVASRAGCNAAAPGVPLCR